MDGDNFVGHHQPTSLPFFPSEGSHRRLIFWLALLNDSNHASAFSRENLFRFSPLTHIGAGTNHPQN
jgi:hypothetical protein